MKINRSLPDTCRLGLVGIAGYAGYLGNTLSLPDASASQDGFSRPEGLRLCEMFVPDPENHADRIDELSRQGVGFHASYETLLESGIDAVWLPVPIHLHRSMTETALERGVAVMCEKPVAATVDDVLAMIEARDRSGLPVLIGFQNLYEPATLELKHQLISLRKQQPFHATVTGGWPRGSVYFGRNKWAGRLRDGRRWVLDGPASNAMAHFINLACFLLGSSPLESATPVTIEVELYSTNPIESYDTFSARVRFEDGATLTILLTHACAEEMEPTVIVKGEDLKAVWRDSTDHIQIDINGQRSEIMRDIDPRTAMMNYLLNAVTHDSAESLETLPAATLETSLVHTVITNGAVQASEMHRLPSDAYRNLQIDALGQIKAIAGVEDAIEVVAQDGQLLHELDMFKWTRPAGSLDLRNYKNFKGPRASLESHPLKPTIMRPADSGIFVKSRKSLTQRIKQ